MPKYRVKSAADGVSSVAAASGSLGGCGRALKAVQWEVADRCQIAVFERTKYRVKSAADWVQKYRVKSAADGVSVVAAESGSLGV